MHAASRRVDLLADKMKKASQQCDAPLENRNTFRFPFRSWHRMRHCWRGMVSLQAILDEIGTNYREIIDAAREMVVIHAVDGSVLLANRATQEVIGFPEADLLRMN